MSFQNKVAVVTGGASGIGEATARLLAARGASVMVADVTDDAGERVVAEIKSAGGAAAFHHVDVSDAASTQDLVDRAVATFGDLHLAANIAGIGQPPSRLHDMDEAVWDRIMGIDLKGVWLCMRAQLNYFLANGGGAIVNMASGAGLKAIPGQPAYAAAKAGVISLSQQAALEYARDGIRVNAVAPGLIDTPAVASLPAEIRAQYAAGQPSGQLGRPVDVAHTVAWLLSDEAAYVSGTTHLVDGAWFQG